MKKKNKRREESDYFVLRYGTGIEDRERLNSEEDKSRSGARNMCFELVCVREGGERERGRPLDKSESHKPECV
jgi:hypothetical protein